MNEAEREARLARLRENSRRYYEAHKQELAAKRKTARRAKLDAMSDEEREALKEKNRVYQADYRRRYPQKVAVWTAKTALRRLERYGQETVTNDRQ